VRRLEDMTARFYEKYRQEIVPGLMKQFKYKNVMQVPKLQKIVVNMGVSEAKTDSKYMDSAITELEKVTGQHPLVKKAKHSIAGFKLRQGMPVGCMVTLRGERMWEFVDRLITIVLPRIKDFQGVSEKAFDGKGNYNLGLKEQLIFPEIDYDSVARVRGMNVTFVTSASNDEEAMALFSALGMPFRR